MRLGAVAPQQRFRHHTANSQASRPVQPECSSELDIGSGMADLQGLLEPACQSLIYSCRFWTPHRRREGIVDMVAKSGLPPASEPDADRVG
jgi:hypothetical protein